MCDFVDAEIGGDGGVAPLAVRDRASPPRLLAGSARRRLFQNVTCRFLQFTGKYRAAVHGGEALFSGCAGDAREGEFGAMLGAVLRPRASPFTPHEEPLR